MTKEYDLVVIGSGPGGYVAAIRAGQLGLKTAVIDKRKRMGGTCLNVGCVPSKTLLHATELYHKMQTEAQRLGVECSKLKFNLPQALKNQQDVIEGLGNGIQGLMKKNKVDAIEGKATLTGPNTIDVNGQSIQAKNILLATGSQPIAGPFGEFDEKVVLSSTGALSLPKIPKRMVVVGAGVIGLEMASVYSRIGTDVVIVELMNEVLPGQDKDVCKTVQQLLKKQGMTVQLGTKVQLKSKSAKGVKIALEKNGKVTDLDADVILVSIGRSPYTEGLGLETVGVKMTERGQVLVDDHYRSSVSNIYAIGDIVDGPMLAHRASEEGVAVVEALAGKSPHVNHLAIPGVVYTWPEVASVGLTEQECKERGLDCKIGKFFFKGNSRARCTGDDSGFVKVIGESKTDRIVGMHIVGANAGDLIHEGVLAIEKKMTLAELGAACHAHPTYAEAVKEAALAAHGEAIHA
ncbi:MAG: dihydrolipoyl dehydrogenase [Waddliaceae bacterium]|nr:dihydrolipoyl dehydrogenase [Waddliaceae bacterium]